MDIDRMHEIEASKAGTRYALKWVAICVAISMVLGGGALVVSNTYKNQPAATQQMR